MAIKRNLSRGSTLIETVMSLWILGIVVLSVMTVASSSFAKRNQNRLQAYALAKSEFQICSVSIAYDHQKPLSYSVLLVQQSETVEGKKEQASFYKRIICNASGAYLTESGELFGTGGISADTLETTESIPTVGNISGSYKKLDIDLFQELQSIAESADKNDSKYVSDTFETIARQAIALTMNSSNNTSETSKDTQATANIADEYGVGRKVFLIDVKYDTPLEIKDSATQSIIAYRVPTRITVLWKPDAKKHGMTEKLNSLVYCALITYSSTSGTSIMGGNN